MTIRLDDERAAMLEMVARAEETTTTDTIREAIDEAIDRRRQDPEFKARLQRIIERDKEILDRLAG